MTAGESRKEQSPEDQTHRARPDKAQSDGAQSDRVESDRIRAHQLKAHTLIIGIGNRYRGDDAFGCIAVQALSDRVPQGVSCIEHDGEPAGLIECWQDADSVILIDAVSSGAAPGSIFRFDLTQQALPEAFNLYSTHAFGVPQAVELARALGKLPRVIRFIGAEGECFDSGEQLSAPLVTAKDMVVAEILRGF